MTPPFANSYWLEPGRILCGEYPRQFDDAGPHRAMSAVLSAGVRVFVDLTEPDELKPYRDIASAAARTLGIDASELAFHRFPIRDVSVPRSQAQMREILHQIDQSRNEQQLVYIHCWGGIGRTGTVGGCLLSEWLDCDGTTALNALQQCWQSCAKSSIRQSPETAEQCEFVRNWTRSGSLFARVE